MVSKGSRIDLFLQMRRLCQIKRTRLELTTSLCRSGPNSDQNLSFPLVFRIPGRNWKLGILARGYLEL